MADNRVRFVSAGLFEKAKHFWLTAMVSKIVIAILGFCSAYFQDTTALFAASILLLESIASWSFYRAESLKSEAEPILMRLDFEESVGWTIPDSSKAEWLADFGKYESLGASVRTDEPYFATTTLTGIAALRRNMLESALYTRTIASNAKGVVFAVFSLLILSVFVLLVSGAYQLLKRPGETASAFITDALIVLVTLDLLPLALRYGELAAASTKLRSQLNPITAPTEANIMPSVIEYQIARSYAPLLPTFAFLARRLPLASIWSSYVTDETDKD